MAESKTLEWLKSCNTRHFLPIALIQILSIWQAPTVTG